MQAKAGGWPPIAIMPGARHNQVVNVCWLSWQTPIDKYEHQEGMTLVIKAQEVFFSTIGNIQSTPINTKSQVVLELVNPITLWILWKQRCGWVLSKETVHPIILMQDICRGIEATLRSQYDGLKEFWNLVK